MTQNKLKYCERPKIKYIIESTSPVTCRVIFRCKIGGLNLQYSDKITKNPNKETIKEMAGAAYRYFLSEFNKFELYEAEDVLDYATE